MAKSLIFSRCGAVDGAKNDGRSSQENSSSEAECSRLRPTLFVIPLPAILVGYADSSDVYVLMPKFTCSGHA